jgi:hypothetical protein
VNIDIPRILWDVKLCSIFEEDAEDFLADRGIRLVSHSAVNICRQAYSLGWKPGIFSSTPTTTTTDD